MGKKRQTRDYQTSNHEHDSKQYKNTIANRTYQDSVFCNLFSDPIRGIELVNALCHTNYQASDLQNVTLHYTLKRDRYNDLAFLTKDQQLIIFFEHQSSFDPNIPIRTLLYVVRSYEKWLAGEYGEKSWDLHSKKKIPLPQPKIFVLYTGSENHPPMEILSLFDNNFENPVVQCHVTCYNLTKYEQLEQLKLSKTLVDYQFLITTIKLFQKQEQNLEFAIEKAVNLCLQQGRLSDYLKKRKSEVMNMLALEYTFEEELKDTAQASYKSGFDDGFNNGRLKERALTKKVFHLFLSNYSIPEIATQCGISQEEVQLILE